MFVAIHLCGEGSDSPLVGCLWEYPKKLVPAPAKKKYPPMSLFDPLTLAM